MPKQKKLWEVYISNKSEIGDMGQAVQSIIDWLSK